MLLLYAQQLLSAYPSLTYCLQVQPGWQGKQRAGLKVVCLTAVEHISEFDPFSSGASPGWRVR